MNSLASPVQHVVARTTTHIIQTETPGAYTCQQKICSGVGTTGSGSCAYNGVTFQCINGDWMLGYDVSFMGRTMKCESTTNNPFLNCTCQKDAKCNKYGLISGAGSASTSVSGYVASTTVVGKVDSAAATSASVKVASASTTTVAGKVASSSTTTVSSPTQTKTSGGRAAVSASGGTGWAVKYGVLFLAGTLFVL